MSVFVLPDVGEGLTEAEVVRWLVAVGDEVAVNQPLVEIETAKALVELPSPYAGTVSVLHAGEGHTLAVGLPLVTIEEQQSGQPLPQGPGEGDEPARQSVLVGYGVDPAVATRRRHRRPAPNPQGTETEEPGPPGEVAKPVRLGGLEMGRSAEARLKDGSGPALAKPPVRKLAKELGVDLASVDPTGPGGVITRADVQRAAAGQSAHGFDPVAGQTDEVVPVRGVMRSMAAAMVQSAFSAPHVTTWLDVDVGESMALLDRLRARHPDVRWSITVLALAALERTALQYPGINATWDEEAIRQHRDIRLGMAVASQRGLLVARVPSGSLVDLAGSVADVVARARSGALSVDELTGTTITLTNIGVFGVDGGTPILPPGQVAILCLGRVIDRPWVVDGRVEVRPVCTVALAFDHRCVDGELGSRALTTIAEFLADPAVAMAG